MQGQSYRSSNVRTDESELRTKKDSFKPGGVWEESTTVVKSHGQMQKAMEEGRKRFVTWKIVLGQRRGKPSPAASHRSGDRLETAAVAGQQRARQVGPLR
eukprot:EG_transcript_68888